MRFFLTILIVLTFSEISSPVTVYNLRHSSSPEKTRLVLDLDAQPSYSAQEGWRKIRVELEGGKGTLREWEIGDGLVEKVISGKKGSLFWIDIYLEKPCSHYRIFSLRAPPRLVIDIFPEREEYRIRTVVLDPGHGGKDPGAVGWRGIKEKNITLDICLRIRENLEDYPLQVFLTRKRDIFLPLRKRVEFANTRRADLFLSIHCNASIRKSSTGFETFFLSPATDDLSRAVAMLENSVIALEDPHRKTIFTIVEDLTLIQFRKESIRLAEIIQNCLDSALPTPNRGVKSAQFYVLKGVHAPSVLVEVGFISNPKDARLLSKSYYREKIAQAICRAILLFKRELEISEGFIR